jgi:hypothetical protein
MSGGFILAVYVATGEELADVLQSLPTKYKFEVMRAPLPNGPTSLKDGLENILRATDNSKSKTKPNLDGLIPAPSEEAETLARSTTIAGTLMQAVREFGETVPAQQLLRSVAEVTGVSEDKVNKALSNLVYNRRLFRHGKYLSLKRQRTT